jgi:hypothetical protein
MTLAVVGKGIRDPVSEGFGVLNPAVPAALKECLIAADQLGGGAQYVKFDPAAARKLRFSATQRRARSPERSSRIG